MADKGLEDIIIVINTDGEVLMNSISGMKLRSNFK